MSSLFPSPSTSSLQRLNLSRCDLSAGAQDYTGLTLMWTALTRNRCLRWLDLSHGNLPSNNLVYRARHTPHMDAALAMLEHNHFLDTIDLSENQVNPHDQAMFNTVAARSHARWAYHAEIALFMGKHPRLGRDSPVMWLSFGMLVYISRFLTVPRRFLFTVGSKTLAGPKHNLMAS